ncbi:MAG: ClpXP protease specificity-enhancing factor SspB [Rhodospirillaceae bacterium]
MAREQLRYDKMVEAALRGVVRTALKQVAEIGLPGNHHFYLTFRTSYRGVRIPDYLRSQYPGEMTIVLQYQFFGLEVTEELFSVTLSFNNVHERLTVPFAAITTFADPSVNFALQFQPVTTEPRPAAEEGVEPLPPPAPGTPRPGGNGGEEKRGEVVALDAFRKK